MGRKPNPLILEHFERGAKLQDSSNRYEHTCKHCGERFPKGRIDGLQGHLFKKCPALSLQDRQKAVLEMNNLPNLTEHGLNGMAQMNGPTVALPIGTGNWTALETLAEVSRQVNLSEHHDDRSVNNQSAGGGSRASEPPRADRLEVQEQYSLDNPPKGYEQRVPKEKKTALHPKRREGGSSISHPPPSHLPHSRSTTPSNLVGMAATSMAAAAAARFQPSMVDPQLLGEDAQRQESMVAKSIEQQLSEANAYLTESFQSVPGQPEQEVTWPMIDGSGSGMNNYVQESVEPQNNMDEMEGVEITKVREFAPIAMNHAMTTEFTTEYGNGEKSRKPKVRGRFSAVRRKEVQKVRRLGACIRCRMLKKPCSDGTPCVTCRKVDQARVWKVPCIRTRISEDLEVYSAGLHSVLAYRQVSQVKSQGAFHPSPHQLEFSHYPETGVWATFNALVSQNVSHEGNIDPGLSSNFNTKTFLLLDSDNDDLTTKVDAYMKRMSSTFFDTEPSNFMSVTLRLAQDMVNENHDSLLIRALDLWSIVHMFVDCELKWTIREKVNADAPAGSGPLIDQDNNNNYDLLTLQINAAAEKKAASICKTVLEELERRLLKKQDSNTFETTLIALLLLNCIEKSTWLFKSWEQENFVSRWPLDKAAVHFSSQGDRLTSMIYMLLTTRQVLPKVFTLGEESVLATESPLGPAREYFQLLHLTRDHVFNAQSNHIFEPSNSRCYELRFCSDLLLQNKNAA